MVDENEGVLKKAPTEVVRECVGINAARLSLPFLKLYLTILRT